MSQPNPTAERAEAFEEFVRLHESDLQIGFILAYPEEYKTFLYEKFDEQLA